MTYEELREAYDRLLQENERLKRVAEDAREKLDAAYDSKAIS
ncbi:diguanylate cyclase/phosphodiesterase [Aeromonas encheleia]|nr:diguanylate cyclase/phosphodiesterase [Aeromonas encheleia]